MDPVNLLILIAAFLLVTLFCWAVVILYCCIASSCSLPHKPDVISSSAGIYEDPMSIIDLKKPEHWQAVQYSRHAMSENLYGTSTHFPSQVYLNPHLFRLPQQLLHHPSLAYATPPPLPCRNNCSLYSCRNFSRIPVIGDVVYV